MAYATPAQLAEHLLPDAAPANASRLLERASRDVDGALKCAIYATDDDGNPTTAVHIAALREATLEQVSWRLENGDSEGIPSGYKSLSIGSVTLSRDSSARASGSVWDLGDQSRQILDTAGLLQFEPRT